VQNQEFVWREREITSLRKQRLCQKFSETRRWPEIRGSQQPSTGIGSPGKNRAA
jgi:hypothetical protein